MNNFIIEDEGWRVDVYCVCVRGKFGGCCSFCWVILRMVFLARFYGVKVVFCGCYFRVVILLVKFCVFVFFGDFV